MALHTTNIINLLSAHMSIPVILAEQNAPKPKHPYIAIKEMISYIPQPGFPIIETEPSDDGIKQVTTSQPTKTLSVTIYSKTFDSVAELSMKARDWFDFGGRIGLKDLGLVVVNLESIISRDSLIVDDYERRRGFDVMLRFVHTQKRDVEELEAVKYRVNDVEFILKKE